MNNNYFGAKTDITVEQLAQLENGSHILEPKIDGVWVEMTIKNGIPTFKTRKNIEVELIFVDEFKELQLPLPDGTTLCGELEVATNRATLKCQDQGFYSLHLFDILSIGDDASVKSQAWRDRRSVLERIYYEIQFATFNKPNRYLLVPYFSNLFQHRYEYVVRYGGEGCVVKNVNAAYGDGEWFRIKAVETDDFVLMGIGKTDSGDLTGEWGQYKDGRLTYMMRAQPKDMTLLSKENCGKLVAEFKGWGKSSEGKLRHAQFIRVRFDK